MGSMIFIDTINFATTICLGKLNKIKIKILNPNFQDIVFWDPFNLKGPGGGHHNMFLAHIIFEASGWSKFIFTKYVFI